MELICQSCRVQYDDEYQLTYCPHQPFQMRCVVVVKGEERIATSVDQLDAWIEEDRVWRRAGGRSTPSLASVPPGSLTPTYADVNQVSAAWVANMQAVAAGPGRWVTALGGWRVEAPRPVAPRPAVRVYGSPLVTHNPRMVIPPP